MRKLMQSACLPISVLVLALAGWLSWQAQTRERRLIEKYEAQAVNLYEDFGQTPPPNPQTLDELLDPLFKLVKNLQQ